MTEMSGLLEIFPEGSVAAPRDIAHRLRSDSARPALERLLAVLDSGLADAGGCCLGFQTWTRDQVEAVLDVSRLLVRALLGASVEQVGPVASAIVARLLELAISFLERSQFDGDDLRLEDRFALLLGLVLGDTTISEYEVPPSGPLSTYLEQISVIPFRPCNVDDKHNPTCHRQGFDCLENRNIVENFLVTLSSEAVQIESATSQFNVSVDPQSSDSIIALAQHLAIVHSKCLPRLLILCERLLQAPTSLDQQKNDIIFYLRLSFSQKILKFLRDLVKEVPYGACDVELLHSVASYADALPLAFKLKFDFLNGALSSKENKHGSILLQIFEEFLQFCKIVFYEGNIFRNIQAFIIASMIDILASDVWRYDKSDSSLRPPLVYFPQIVLCLLKYLKDAKRWASPTYDMKINVDIVMTDYSCESEAGGPSCHIHGEKFLLLTRHTSDELLNMIFPVTEKWMDNLVNLVSFLHSEATKLSLIDKSRSSSTKPVTVPDLEIAVAHEDEAIFGNLFSEPARPVSSVDGPDQSTAVPSTANSDLLVQAASELLSFLNLCIFSPEWCHTVFDDACRKFNKIHMDQLLPLLDCRLDGRNENPQFSRVLGSPSNLQFVSGVCFELLQNLVVHHILSSPLKEHLVDQVLKVEDGNYVYNQYSLTLLAHALVLREDLDDSYITKKIYEGYVNFILQKARDVCCRCPENSDVLLTLPSSLHLEIVLMAFHLSNEAEKSSLANFVLSSLRKVDTPPSGFNAKQLLWWGLLVSRIILILRHAILYPSTCPSWLLFKLRSRMREIPSKICNSVSQSNQLLSWVSSVAMSLLGDSGASTLSNLLSQLIDITSLPASFFRDETNQQRLGLNWTELISTFSWILGFWNGKKVETVDQLLLERYIFSLCWSAVSTKLPGPIDTWVIGHSWKNLDACDVRSFFNLGLILGNEGADVCRDTNFFDVICDIVERIGSDVSSIQSWDFLRKGAWMSLLLSLLSSSLSEISLTNITSEVEPPLIHQPEISGLSYVRKSIILNISQSSKAAQIINILSSILKTYLQIFHKTIICTLDQKRLFEDAFSPLLLVKHTCFEKSRHDFLLDKSGCSISHMESIYKLLPELDEVSIEGSGSLNVIIMKCLLHGFPSNPYYSDGALLSCVLIIEEIICFLDEFVKVKCAVGSIQLGADFTCELLETLMAVKCDRIFQCIHEKCDSLCNSLIGQQELVGYLDLFIMKQLEGYLERISFSEMVDSGMQEMLIDIIVDFIDGLRKEPSKKQIFDLFLGFEEGLSEKAKELFSKQHGKLLVLMDALDNCHFETVNLKVLNLFNDLMTYGLCSMLKQQIQRKLIEMDLSILSCWLEKRLLGTMTESTDGAMISKGSSLALRESTRNFLVRLVSQPCEISRELHGRLVQALLIPLDRAFILFDAHIAKDYFNFIIQILNGEPSSMKLLLEKTVTLMEKLVGNESLLHGLNFLFSFIGALLGDLGSDKNSSDKLSSKLSSTNSLGSGALVSKTVNSRKNSESLVIPANQESGSASIDCDVTSADEDDDDGTSDGEFGSIDKEEEDDNNSERALASKVCTFTSSGSNFMEQHWYFCYTCNLTVSKGCCSICAKVCHRGHRVVYSRSSRFFCDCGAGGVRGSSCQCLKPRKFTGENSAPSHSVSNLQPLIPVPTDSDQGAESDSDLDDDVSADSDNSFKLSVPKKLQDDLPALLGRLDVEGRIIGLCHKLLPTVICRRDLNLSKDKKVILGVDKILSLTVDLFQLKKAYKSGSLDLKIKADYPNSRELKSHLASGSLAKSLLSISARGRLAAGEGDKVAIFDVGQLIGQPTVAPVTADKTNVKPLSKNIVRFEIVHLIFNPMVDNYLAVAGFEDCQVLTVNPRGEVTDRLAIELALQGAYIRRVDWVPGSQVQLMVVTNMFVKIYDLSQDNISPKHYFTLSDDVIVDATLVPASMGKAFLLVLSEAGHLFRLEVSMEGNVGAKMLTDTIAVLDQDVQRKGLSLHFSLMYRLLFLSYQDGTTLMGRLDANSTTLTEISLVFENDQDNRLRPAGLHHWKELVSGSGLFVCLSSLKSNAALAVSLSPNDMFAQNMKFSAGVSLPLVGVAAYKPLSKDKIHCLMLQDDGSLQIYSYVPIGVDTASNVSVEQTKKLGSSILNNKAYASANPDFPLDFFEKTMCITGDVKFSSDAIKNADPEGIRQRLASDEGFLECPNSAGFKVTVSNSNPDIVMVGCRIQVGNTSASHIPSEVTIFQRVIKLEEGMHSWYDIPFTIAESLLADEEFTISVGRTFDGTTMPRIDSLEVYGRAKDEFGWKEKMDDVLDMEAHVLGIGSGPSLPGKKRRNTQSSPIQEQVLADAVRLLSRIYSFFRSQYPIETEDVDVQLKELKCGNLLETIFQSDREPLLQSAACRVLQAVFPKRDVYYQVKDTMRLLGAVKSFPMLISRVGVGGPAAAWVIKEFTSQMHAVSKIALVRRSNMAIFLETYGPEVIDGLIQVLWAILDLERPETQTINSIIIPSVELIYSYAECLALHGNQTRSVAPAVSLLKKLLFAPYEAVQTSSSLAISSRLLQVPFPKQTMLASDDPAENPVIAQVSSDVNPASGNAQVMIEEDSTISSVQYCCDGCSTVPILRRRWHCNVCPDFDLCEACYEVLDADQLPPPHYRDHPMSAIPIDIDSIAGDGNEIHFSMDELNEASLTPTATEISMQNPSSSIHVLDANESGDFTGSLPDQTIVSISASQRALNSLLLRHLIEELKGWMETTSGFRAIPVMQLFYRLSSAVGGPFMDSSKPENLDLEKFVKWLLDEINLSRPFPAKTRSSFGEVTILVFMFFTLMLRNWHQPGGDNSQSKPSCSADLQDKCFVPLPLSASTTSSSDDPERMEFAIQLVRACSFLRQQSFLNYLMDILQQLVNVFKSSSVNVESGISAGSGCGSLLTVRRELPAGNFSPFFSDSYAKSHCTDMFMDYHKLLLENTFRLVYSLVRPEKQEKITEKDKTYKTNASKDLKLDGFQDVLCSYISNPHTTFVRRYARRLFLHLCGSKTQYYSIRDSWQFSNEVKRLHKLISKSGGFETPVPYERNVKLVKCLTTISEVATARPRNWQKYCSKHIELLPILMNGIFNFGEESVIQTLKLLNLAFYAGKDMSHSTHRTGGDETASSARLQASDLKKKKKSEDTIENGSERTYLDMEQAVEIFTTKDGNLRKFIDSFLLEWNSSSVRHEAKNVLFGLWRHGKQSFKEGLLTALLQKLKHLPMYGQNILEYTELMTWLLGKMSDSNMKQYETELVNRCLTSDVITCIFETLHSQNELLANHPNSRIYSTLSNLVEFDGYYLESEPCVTCSCPEVPYSRIKLESLKSESKFTDNRIIVKCTGSYTIQSVTMNVHDARKSKSVKVLNLYYNNKPVSDLSELKNNWVLWKRAKSCHLAFNQTELKVEFPIPITACNFMIELDSFYENLQASSLESLQCPRCSKSVTDKHGICSNCHENAYQCRQCRNINYENLDSFLCNECGYSKYGRFEFNFMAKPSFSFDNMENDEDMRKGLAAIESESENAHRRYQQLLGFKKPLLKLVSSIGENELDSQQKDSVQQMMVSLPGPSCKVNRKIALLGVLYGEKCKTAFDSVSKSVQTLQGLKRVVMTYLQQKNSDDTMDSSRFAVPRSPNNCYGCAITFVTQCLELLHVLSKHAKCKKQLVAAGILSELFENNIHQGPKTARVQARAVLCALSEGDADAVSELNTLIKNKVIYCLEHHRSIDVALATREELLLLSETCALVDEFWEARLRVAFQLLFSSIKVGAKHPAISEHIILPSLRIISQACTPPRSDSLEEQGMGKSTILQPKNDHSLKSSASPNSLTTGIKATDFVEKHSEGGRKGQEIPLLSYSEWERGASYLDFVRRQYKVSQTIKSTTQRNRQEPQKNDYLALKYALKWKRRACRGAAKSDISSFALGSWVSELILSACSPSIRSEVCTLVSLLCPQNSSRCFQLLNLLMSLLPSTLSVGESAAEFFELFCRMIDSEAARLYLTVKGCLTTLCSLITLEVHNIESQERSLSIDVSQGFTLHKLVELLTKFLEVPNIRIRFMQDDSLSKMLEALFVIRGLIVQKTKLINDCNRLLKDLLDGLLLESTENKWKFIRACISSLQNHGHEQKRRTSLFILEQLCNMICPSKPEPVYLLILNKAHTQEEFIRGSMTKNPYSSIEIGPLMRDVKNKICHQLDLLGLLEDDYGMELLVAGNIISLDLSISQVYEQVWKKYYSQTQNTLPTTVAPSSAGLTSTRDCPPMTVTYRLQGLDGEATEPMIKELEEEREESQDPEVEFAITGAVKECGGLEIILSMIQRLRDDELKLNPEELGLTLNLLMFCCKIRENRRALLRLGALGLLLETARRAFSVDAFEPAEGILLIVESLTMEANESDIGIHQSVLTVTNEESGAGEQAKKIVLMFLERLFHPMGTKKSSKQQRNDEMVARILPYLTYGETAAMEALVQHFEPYLQVWGDFDQLQKQHQDNPKDENLAHQAAKQRSALENFVRVSESLKTSSCGERLKDIILEKGIIGLAVRHLRESFAFAGQAGFKSSAEWSVGLKLPSVPLILSMLRGLSKGHLPTQRCIDEEGILPLLHALEGVSGENEIGARAENLLDTLADKEGNGDGFLGEKIRKLRHATRDEMRRLALRNREQLLHGLGMHREFAVDGVERIVVTQPAIEGLEDVEEEDGLACMVCREGYTLKPNDMLGVYSFSKRVNLYATNSASLRGDFVFTTVSHFNVIHFQCHQEAKRADTTLKNPKKEWEGATLRNNETLCNCIFPLRGPSVPAAQYVRCIDQFWDNLTALGRADSSRLRLLTYDIVLMLARFATGASFSTDCKGGGRESNSRFLPFMIQMASYLLDQGNPSQQRQAIAKSVAAYLSNSSSTSDLSRASPSLPGSRSSSPSDETVQFMMVNSLLSESYEDWLQHRPAFLQRGIYYAYMQHKHGRSTLRLSDAASGVKRSDEGPSMDLSDGSKLFTIVQPMLIYTGLIEQLQQFFKRNKRSQATSSEPVVGEDSSAGGLEKWEITMKEKLVNMKEMLRFSEELLSWLEDMNAAADLQEAFDVMGALRDALSGGSTGCEEFVRAAILSGKS